MWSCVAVPALTPSDTLILQASLQPTFAFSPCLTTLEDLLLALTPWSVILRAGVFGGGGGGGAGPKPPYLATKPEYKPPGLWESPEAAMLPSEATASELASPYVD